MLIECVTEITQSFRTAHFCLMFLTFLLVDLWFKSVNPVTYPQKFFRCKSKRCDPSRRVVLGYKQQMLECRSGSSTFLQTSTLACIYLTNA